MKKLIDNYTFTASARTIVFNDYSSINPSGLLLITNAIDNIIIYNFASASLGGIVSGNTLTLTYNTSTMSDDDSLQIFYEDQIVPATSNKQDDIILNQEIVIGLIETLQELSQNLRVLGAVKGVLSDLRVTPLSLPTTCPPNQRIRSSRLPTCDH